MNGAAQVVSSALRSIEHAYAGFAVFDGEAESVRAATYVLCRHGWLTFERVIAGTLIGVVAGAATGGAVFALGRRTGAPSAWMTLARSVPLFALVPLFQYWFAGASIGVVMYISFATFTVVSAGTLEALRNVPPVSPLLARLLGASPRQVIQSTYVPAALPEFLTTIRSTLGLAWAFSLGAEYVSAEGGLGYLTYQSYLYADMGKLIILAILYSVVAACTVTIARRVSPSPRWLAS